MQSSKTPRFKLPLLIAGQSQKELFHNEALSYLDFIIHPVVESVENDPNSLTVEHGSSWLVDSAPVGDWAGRADHVASWTTGGWRFVEPIAAMQLYVENSHETGIFQNNSWQFAGSISAPAGGSVVDVEARQAIESILESLQMKDIIAS